MWLSLQFSNLLNEASWMQAGCCGQERSEHRRGAGPWWGHLPHDRATKCSGLLKLSMHWEQDAYRLQPGHMRNSPGFSDLEPSAQSTWRSTLLYSSCGAALVLSLQPEAGHLLCWPLARLQVAEAVLQASVGPQTDGQSDISAAGCMSVILAWQLWGAEAA